VLRQCKPLPKHLTQTKSDLRIRIQICGLIWTQTSAGLLPKCCLYIISSVSVVSVSVWKTLINLLKFHILQLWWKWKSDLETVSETRSSRNVDQFFQLVGSIITSSFNKIGSLLFQFSNPAQRQIESLTNSTSYIASTFAEVNI